MFDAIIKLKNNRTNTIVPTRASSLIKSTGQDFDGFKKREEVGKWMSDFKKQMKYQKEVSVVSFRVTEDIIPDVVTKSRDGNEYRFVYAGDDNWVINFGDLPVNVIFDDKDNNTILSIDPPGGLINGGPLSAGQQVQILHNRFVGKITYVTGSYVITMKNDGQNTEK